MVRIITNADDFGMDEDTVRATVECLDAGALTSATIMPNMPATSLAVAYARAHPEKSFGAHLTYVTDTVESTVSDPAALPSLAVPDGRFHDSRTARLRALRNRIAVDEIVRETTAQLQRLVDSGVRVSHVDSHGHLHKFGPFRRALERVLPRFGITKVRNVQNVYLSKPLRSPTYWCGFWWRRKIMGRFTTTQDFFMPPSGKPDASWPEPLLARIGRSTTIEVGVHPGHREPWRDAERRAIQAFAAAARHAGHQLIGWSDL